MTIDSRTLTVNNKGTDLTTLANNKYNLQAAKSVAKGDQRESPRDLCLQYELMAYLVVFNIVWQSKVLGPKINVKWKPIYGLNWTMVITPS